MPAGGKGEALQSYSFAGTLLRAERWGYDATLSAASMVLPARLLYR
jgi:hypothetical protein